MTAQALSRAAVSDTVPANALDQQDQSQDRSNLQQAQQPHDDQMQPLPVSAVAAGKAQKYAGSLPLGSDIMADVIAEEEIAAAAQMFMSKHTVEPG